MRTEGGGVRKKRVGEGKGESTLPLAFLCLFQTEKREELWG